jgi:hypothetical protein
MRTFVLSLIAIVAVLVPNVGRAQAYPPEVTAATADWQLNSEPISSAARSFSRHARLACSTGR